MCRALRRRLTERAVLAALLWLWVSALPVFAAGFLDPRFRFRTLETAHFSIHYHQGEEAMARRLAAIAEDAWPKVGGALGVTSPSRTHVVLADQTELANGWATPLPYNTIFLTAAAPAGSEFIGRNDDWLRLVFIHEFTHIVHLDRSEGWAKIFRGLFGRTPVAFPNLFLPQWAIEGLAQYEESALTGDGRAHAGDYRAIEREAGRARVAEPIDRVNGGLIDWPGGTGGYAYGLGFHEWLAREYGAERFAALTEVTAGTAPFAGTMAFDRVYGQSVESLWDDYRRSLEGPAAASVVTVSAPPRQITHHGFTVLGPRIFPAACAHCGERIVYSVRNPDGFPALREVSLDGTESRELVWRYLGATVGVTPDTVVFDQQEFRRNTGLYSDLFALDRRTNRVRALSRESRLQDPDVDAATGQIVAVRQRDDRRELVIVPWDGVRLGEVRVLASEAETAFNAPRWSPDGRQIVAARHQRTAQSDLVLVDATTGTLTALASAPRARIVTPTWRPDGHAVIAAADFDGDTFNLYEFNTAQPAEAPKRLTAVRGGATWPDVSRDGQTLVFVGYTTAGFDLFTMPYPTSAAEAPAPTRQPVATARPAPIVDGITAPARRYSPWSTLAPRTWTPVVRRDTQLRAGAFVAGSDVLGRHLYAAEATWLVDAPSDATRPPAARPDWDVAYTYDRWQPALFASVSSGTLFSAGEPDATGRPDQVTLRQREFEAGVYLPVRRARATHRLIGSVTGSALRPLYDGECLPLDRVAVRGGLSTSTARTFGYSISQEQGYTVGGTVAAVRRAFGSTFDATVVTADARGYLRGLGRHHVLAARVAGGADIEGRGAGQLFLLGGGTPNPDVLDFSRDALSLMRGFAAASVAGTRVGVVNVDYRFPIARPQRGVGVWPVFLQNVHGAAFVDAGGAWRGRMTRDDLKTSVGGELAFDLVAGFAFPTSVAIGSGWGHDRRDGSNRGTIYVRIGRAF